MTLLTNTKPIHLIGVLKPNLLFICTCVEIQRVSDNVFSLIRKRSKAVQKVEVARTYARGGLGKPAAWLASLSHPLVLASTSTLKGTKTPLRLCSFVRLRVRQSSI